MITFMRDTMSNNETSSGSSKPEASTGQNGAIDIAMPITPNLERIAEAVDRLEKLKASMLEYGKDKVDIQGKTAITRQGFSKIALAYGVSTSIEKVHRIKTDDDYIVHIIARASLPNGRFAEANASCSKSEFGSAGIKGTIANIEAKAGTRAISRAIANLVGGGIVSKEEIEEGDGPVPQAQRPITLMSDKQKAFLEELRQKHNMTPEELLHCIERRLQKPVLLEDMTRDQASEIITFLKNNGSAQAGGRE